MQHLSTSQLAMQQALPRYKTTSQSEVRSCHLEESPGPQSLKSQKRLRRLVFWGVSTEVPGKTRERSKHTHVNGGSGRNSYCPFFTQISGRNFLPELCGEVHPENAPLQAPCCAPCSTEQSTFEGENRAKRCPEKGGEEGWPAEGAKRNKEARKQDNLEVKCNSRKTG